MPQVTYEYCTVVWLARGDRGDCLIAASTISMASTDQLTFLFCKMLKEILGIYSIRIPWLQDNMGIQCPQNHSDWNLSRSSPVFMLSPQFADKYDKIWFITLSGETCAIHQIGGRGLLQSKDQIMQRSKSLLHQYNCFANVESKWHWVIGNS